MEKKLRDSFTLPGEAGYERLTLELAEKWGADVIRDSDGTKLSPEITAAGYRIYSTICLIREHNAFAQAHPELFFYVTRIGCGIAGFRDAEIAPLFNGAKTLENVCLPESFADGMI